MAISTKLEMRQSQSLIMTPQLMQAIKLLQMSNLDLVAYVEAELERNPLLERTEGGDGTGVADGQGSDHDGAQDTPGGDGFEPGSGEFSSSDGAPSEWLKNDLEPQAESIASQMDTDLGNVFPDEPGVSAAPEPASLLGIDSHRASSSASSEDYNLEAFVAEEESLIQVLMDQMHLAFADPVDKIIGQHLINSLDENGYLQLDLEEAAAQLGIPAARIEAVLAVMQGFEPSGVFARSLAECLALQLKERNRFDPAMEAMIAHIELLARHDYPALRRICGVDEEDLADMIAEIKALDPRPGRAYGSSIVQTMVPDVLVRPASDGGWTVELNTDTLPRVLVNQTYFASITRNARNETERSYLTDCLQTANWLVKSLDQRAKTILKVATEIVRQQDGFLTYGIEHLRPLNLKTIADAIGMHESTISRVTSNKYMATPRGIFELKYFFSSAISATEGGDAHSAEAVRHRIKQMIDAESPDDILSDDTIVKRLKDDGVDIARRTVAKYREAMNLGSSVQRRREKKGLS
ncbi:RNA polymerase factor sigma-54 [Pannonibacter phragmitetus]|uniref:RNA polymerase sigma-54 factor n=1 Tax=Pannonibacter phragmitetus TaxID=121719 RepID=A0A378ZQH9_9HYPH|nr:RNA polymerase factor sigma-54 [Pannonibacter phragmitetus]SUA99454.1 RNA polymerase factor sigma-54 [Pannonibacter phragmitetus]